MVIAPAGNMIEMFDRLSAMGIVDWPSILAMLHNHLPPDDWDHLLDHVGGPLGGELYVRGRCMTGLARRLGTPSSNTWVNSGIA